MLVPIWIIALCTIVRIVQNGIQLKSLLRDASKRDNAYSEFINSLRYTDKEFVKRMLEEFDSDDGK